MRSIINIPLSGTVKMLINFQNVIFDEIVSNVDNHNLSTNAKQYANEYLFCECFQLSGSILGLLIMKLGLDKNSSQYKEIVQAVYSYRLDFRKKLITTKLITGDYFSYKEDMGIFFNVAADISNNIEHLIHFLKTGEPCYYEYEEDEGYLHTSETNYGFVMRIYEVEFQEKDNGINLEFGYIDYFEKEKLDLKIQNLLRCITTLIKMGENTR